MGQGLSRLRALLRGLHESTLPSATPAPSSSSLERALRSAVDFDEEDSVADLVERHYNRRQSRRGSPRSLVDLCVDTICANLLRFEGPLPHGLPPELVERIMASLIAHKALLKVTLRSLNESDMTSLSLASCVGVTDDWLEQLGAGAHGGKGLMCLDLSNCSEITGCGLKQLKGLQELVHVSLKGCLRLSDEGPAALATCHSLVSLDLTDCVNLSGDAIRGLAQLTTLRDLRLAGCRATTDSVVDAMAQSLGSLTALDLQQCDGLTPVCMESLSRLTRLVRLDIAHCTNVSGSRVASLASLQGLADLRLDRVSLVESGVSWLRRLTRLESLRLRGCPGVADSALCCGLPLSLKTLDVSHCRGLRQLPWQSLGCLTTLNLSQTSIRDVDLEGLSHLQALTDLDLDSCHIGDVGLRSLARLSGLGRLILADTEITDDGLQVLSALHSLTSLSLFYCNISDRGVAHLTCLTNLTSLNLDNRDITDTSMSHLACLRKLRVLDVFSARVDVGLCYLSGLTCLTGLELCGGRVSDHGLAHVAKLSSLRSLNLSQNSRVTSAGLMELTRLRKLEALNISHCRVEWPAAVEALMKLESLETLAVNGCPGFNKAAVNDLRRCLPNLRHLRCLSGSTGSEPQDVYSTSTGHSTQGNGDAQLPTVCPALLMLVARPYGNQSLASRSMRIADYREVGCGNDDVLGGIAVGAAVTSYIKAYTKIFTEHQRKLSSISALRTYVTGITTFGAMAVVLDIRCLQLTAHADVLRSVILVVKEPRVGRSLAAAGCKASLSPSVFQKSSAYHNGDSQ